MVFTVFKNIYHRSCLTDLQRNISARVSRISVIQISNCSSRFMFFFFYERKKMMCKTWNPAMIPSKYVLSFGFGNIENHPVFISHVHRINSIWSTIPTFSIFSPFKMAAIIHTSSTMRHAHGNALFAAVRCLLARSRVASRQRFRPSHLQSNADLNSSII